MWKKKENNSESQTSVNDKYKDRLFVFIFGREENKEWTLSLFNAVNGSDYVDPSLIEFNTLDDFLYMGMKNDVSFLVSYQMNLFEHQSSYNPNMPLRMLGYTGQLYSKYIADKGENEYGSTIIKLPVPKLIVFYNGKRNVEDEVILKLSDSFDEEHREESDIEVRVRMININYGRNKALLKASNPLEGYSWFVDKIREYTWQLESMSLESMSDDELKKNRAAILAKAVDRAVKEMPKEYVIRKFLRRHRAEVAGMLETEYDAIAVAEKFRLQGKKEGFQEGLQEGLKEGIEQGRLDERANTEREREEKEREREARLAAEARIKELQAQLATQSK